MTTRVIGSNLIINGSFEDVTGSGWIDLGDNSVEFHGTKASDSVNNKIDPQSGAHYVDLDSAGANAQLAQTVAGVEQGQTYRLTFSIADTDLASATNGVQVLWGGQVIYSGTPPKVVASYPGSAWQTITIDVVGGAGDGSNQLVFKGVEAKPDGLGVGVDNVSLQAVAENPNLIVNGSFEDLSGLDLSLRAWGSYGSAPAGWVDLSAVQHTEVHGTPAMDKVNNLVSAEEGNYWVDLIANTSNSNIKLAQKVAGVETGHSYTLTFSVADTDKAHSDDGMNVYWGGKLVYSTSPGFDPATGTIADGSAVGQPMPADGQSWQTITVQVLGGDGDGSNQLVFQSTGNATSGDLFGVALDNVFLRETTVTAITGTDSHDTLNGTSGADVLIGGKGDDTLSGGEGSDTYIYHSGDGSDTVVEAVQAAGTDTLVLQDINKSDVTFQQHGQDLQLVLHDGSTVTLANEFAGGGVESITFADGSSVSAQQIIMSEFSEALSNVEAGETYDLTLSLVGDGGPMAIMWGGQIIYEGTPGSDAQTITIQVVGGAGNGTDKLVFQGAGDAANELAFQGNGSVSGTLTGVTVSGLSLGHAAETPITGTDGGDTLNGTLGHDVLVGGHGDDKLAGAAGSDTYVYHSGDGSDTIVDRGHQSGVDVLNFADIKSTDVTIQKHGQDIQLVLKDGSTITLQNQLDGSGAGVELITFADGVTLKAPQISAGLTIQLASHAIGSGSGPAWQTLEQAAYAISNGADLLEIDGHLTKDGVVVLRHDDIPEGFANLTYAQVKAEYPDATTLSEMIDLVKQMSIDTGRAVGIDIDTKDARPDYWETVLQTLIDHDFTDPSQVYISAGSQSDVQWLHDVLMPKYGLNIPLWNEEYDNWSNPDLGKMSEYSAGTEPSLGQFDKALVDAAHAFGMIQETATIAGTNIGVDAMAAQLQAQVDQGVDIVLIEDQKSATTVVAIMDGQTAAFGDAHDNMIAGSNGNDLAYAQQGNDTVSGGGGDDLIYGDAGNDVLFGGAGNDHLIGGSGSDLVSGGAGTNVLEGGAGNDAIIAAGSHDEVMFGKGDGIDLVSLNNTTEITFNDIKSTEVTSVILDGTNLIIRAGGDALVIANVDDPAHLPASATFYDGVVWTAAQLEALATAGHDAAVEAALPGLQALQSTSPPNLAPVVVGSVPATTTEDKPATGHIAASDVDGDTLSFTIGHDNGAAHGTVTIDANGNWTYTPADGYLGADSFTVTVSDGHIPVDTVVDVTVHGTNLIVNGSFEDPAHTGWTDLGGHDIELHGTKASDPANNTINPANGGSYVDLNSAGANAQIAQTVANIEDGKTYQLTFSVADTNTASDGTITVYWGGQVVWQGTPPNAYNASTGGVPYPGSEWQTITIDVVGGAGDGSNQLVFQGAQSNTASGHGAAIDNVSLEAINDHPNLIVNGSFEDLTGLNLSLRSWGPYGVGSIAGWTDLTSSSGNHIEVHGSQAMSGSDNKVNAADGDYWVDLTGYTNIKLVQTVHGVEQGKTYDLTFSIADTDAAHSDDGMNVYWGGKLVYSTSPGWDPATGAIKAGSAVGQPAPADGQAWQTITIHVVGGDGDGSNKLEFDGAGSTSTTNDYFGVALDNVSLRLSETAPVAVDDALAPVVADGKPIVISVADLLRNDTDADQDHLTITKVGSAVGGTVTLDKDGIHFTPTSGFTGEASFEYTISDGIGGTSMAHASFDVTPENHLPVTVNDSGEVHEHDTATFDLVHNDTDVEDGQPHLSGFSVTGVDGVNVSLDAASSAFHIVNGQLVYDGGSDIFSSLDDGEHATVTINYTATDNDGGHTDGQFVLTIDGVTDLHPITGTGGADVLSDTTGADHISAGDGSDIIFSSFGDDVIDAGAGNDTVMLQTGDKVVNGGDGNDTINGGTGNSVLNGDGGNDTIIGGSGSETINGGAGNDTLMTGAGNDTVSGGEGNDSIFGGAGNSVLNGDAGNDTINGGLGNETINGGAGNDMLLGGAGNDVISGGAGNDQMFGGLGSDTFVFKAGDGHDTVFDFQAQGASHDVIELDHNVFADFEALMNSGAVHDAAGGVDISYADGSTLSLTGVTKASLKVDDFHFA